jgi:hypothetical protein
MAQIWKYCFDKWWRPMLFWAISLGVLLSAEMLQMEVLVNIGCWLLGFALLALAISTINQLLKKQWLAALLSGLTVAGTIGALIVYGIVLALVENVDGDKWADNLSIPTNIQLDVPLDLTLGNERPDTVLHWIKTAPDFQLYSSFQPGLYEYDFWTGRMESGMIYLKAFEITQEYPLSASRLPERSEMRIYNPTDSIVKFSSKWDFTIYEGDWGKPYAARFEVWFKPDNSGSQQKLLTKNYKIEGWQR